MAHKFSVGQTVELAHRHLQAAPQGPYEIRQRMPASDNDAAEPRYRIKSIEEKHERVASEGDLTLLADQMAQV